MYIPDQFREDRVEVLGDFIARHPLGALVTVTEDGLTANHIPMLWHAREGSAGVLHGHIARANPLRKSVAPDAAVLVIFGGANRYITPSWYPSKQQHGKVVPTWNYSVVHAHGTIRFMDDRDHCLQHLAEMTDRQEAGRVDRWKLTDAPEDFTHALVGHIVAFEITLSRLIGKFKSSQHRPQSERVAVAQALLAEGAEPADVGELVREPRSTPQHS